MVPHAHQRFALIPLHGRVACSSWLNRNRAWSGWGWGNATLNLCFFNAKQDYFLIQQCVLLNLGFELALHFEHFTTSASQSPCHFVICWSASANSLLRDVISDSAVSSSCCVINGTLVLLASMDGVCLLKGYARGAVGVVGSLVADRVLFELVECSMLIGISSSSSLQFVASAFLGVMIVGTWLTFGSWSNAESWCVWSVLVGELI